MCGVAMPVFGPGGDVVAAIEVAVADLGHELPPIMAALAIASRSLSRELAAGEARLASALPTQPGHSARSVHWRVRHLTRGSPAAPGSRRAALASIAGCGSGQDVLPGAVAEDRCLRLPTRGGLPQRTAVSDGPAAQSSHQEPRPCAARSRHAAAPWPVRAAALGDHVPRLGSGRADDARRCARRCPARTAPGRSPVHRLVGRLPRHDVVVDRAHHVGRRLDRATGRCCLPAISSSPCGSLFST